MKVYLIFLLIPWLVLSSENEVNNPTSIKKNLETSFFGKFCWGKTCEKNQYCNELLICQCCQGFKYLNGYCTPCVGENEKCEKTEDCCGRLICIKGICRRARANIEFIALAKICLAITATTVMIAVFTYLVKCLMRYGKLQGYDREDDTVDINSRETLPSSYIEQEKPPSYEECISSRNLLSEPPPPYVICSNVPQTFEGNGNNVNLEGATSNQLNIATIALNNDSLEHSTNTNTLPKKDEKFNKGAQKIEELDRFSNNDK